MTTTDIAFHEVPYTKLHGLGNDFVMVSDSDLLDSDWGAQLLNQWHKRGHLLAKSACERHFGVGADGLILSIDPANLKDPRLDKESEFSAYRIFDFFKGNMPVEPLIGWAYLNSDGSASSVCGNGFRCLAKFVMQRGIVRNSEFMVATPLSPEYGETCSSNGKHLQTELIHVTSVSGSHSTGGDWYSVDLGEPTLKPSAIPVSINTSNTFVVKEKIKVAGYEFPITCVNMGNPHCVIFDAPFMKDIDAGSGAINEFPRQLAELAPAIQQAAASAAISAVDGQTKLFPEGVNVEFAFVHNEKILIIYVWERGCGPTLACASGAAAALVAGVLEQRISRKMTVRFGPPTPHYPNRDLLVEWCENNNHVVMTGPAEEVSKGLFKFQGVSV